MHQYIRTPGGLTLPVQQIVTLNKQGRGGSATLLGGDHGIHVYVSPAAEAWDYLKSEAGFLEIDLGADGPTVVNPAMIALERFGDGRGRLHLPTGSYGVSALVMERIAAALEPSTKELGGTGLV